MSDFFPSRDGKIYKTGLEAKMADLAWNEKMAVQEQQNKLLEEQNRLILQNQISQNKIQEEQRKNHEEQIATIKDETIKQKKIAEESRILRLFDDIGLNKRYYDNYISYLFSGFTYEDRKNLKNLSSSINNIEFDQEELEQYLNGKDINDKYFHLYEIDLNDCYKINNNATIKKLNKCLINIDDIYFLEQKDINAISDDVVSDIGVYNNNLSNKNLFCKLRSKNTRIFKVKKILKWSCIISVILGILLLAILKDKSDDSLFMFLCFIYGLFSGPILYAVAYSIHKSNDIVISNIINYELKKMNSVLDMNKVNQKIQEKIDANKSSIKKEIKQKNDLLSKIKKSVNPKWDDFVKFRKDHYLYDFEKLLLDMELDKKIKEIGLEYPKINKGTKMADGTIEDYVEYFDSLID